MVLNRANIVSLTFAATIGELDALADHVHNHPSHFLSRLIFQISSEEATKAERRAVTAPPAPSCGPLEEGQTGAGQDDRMVHGVRPGIVVEAPTV